MSQRLGTDAWLIFLDDVLDGVYRTAAPVPADLRRRRQLQEQYRDLRIGVVDASVIALVERLGEDKVATLDHRHSPRSVRRTPPRSRSCLDRQPRLTGQAAGGGVEGGAGGGAVAHHRRPARSWRGSIAYAKHSLGLVGEDRPCPGSVAGPTMTP